MSLDRLTVLIHEDELSASFDEEQLDLIYMKFTEDFINSPFEVNGKLVKIYTQKSRIKQYSKYCESFVHIISREYASSDGRIYICDRANRVHWIKTILLSHPCKDIYYYKWLDDKGVCKEHFWYFNKNFMVVLKDIGANVQIVTAFCVDPDEKLKYYERYTDYRDGNGTC
ncbi:hypothetical protein [Mucilaginibacter sp.]|uniref:hypothetical protein n=1 Tax=Mucilaginibacter sp. TaxID=1882438 RepID=UPI00284F33C7|nr:hypothetical protein [Mucilaginibacter sp.]MDR3693331.1 hypothetical protein [Mucilaginibacter sp.]